MLDETHKGSGKYTERPPGMPAMLDMPVGGRAYQPKLVTLIGRTGEEMEDARPWRPTVSRYNPDTSGKGSRGSKGKGSTSGKGSWDSNRGQPPQYSQRSGKGDAPQSRSYRFESSRRDGWWDDDWETSSNRSWQSDRSRGSWNSRW